MWPETTPEDLTEELKRIFQDLDRCSSEPAGPATGSWTPLVDVVETDSRVEIRCDLAGVAPESIRVLIKGPAVLLAGDKRRPQQADINGFHLVERAFGRFARVVRPAAAFDARHASAALADGALTVSLPKLLDRRGEEIFVPVIGSTARS